MTGKAPPTKTVDASCKGCRHYAKGYNNPWCDYIGNTGHRRPCKAGEGCTEYDSGKRRRRRVALAIEPKKASQPKTRRKIDEKEARSLYDKGLSDKEIAGKIGCSSVAIFCWRCDNELPPNFKRGGGRVKVQRRTDDGKKH